MLKTIERLESSVRTYSRLFDVLFTKARGDFIYDASGRAYIDLFAGAGALNYGHNHPALTQKLIDYIRNDGIAHGLDMATRAKTQFLETFAQLILEPRRLDYRFMFPGPTGTNAVEAALKLARKVTKRSSVVAFANAFHGMTLGALAATGNQRKREGAGVPLHDIVRMPFDGYHGRDIDTIALIEKLLCDPSSGVSPPAAFLVETIQGEGGVNVASVAWLEALAELANAVGALLIVDDIQVGCGRSGSFFSFDRCAFAPDIVCLSKSLSGLGLPLSLVLLKPDYDIWQPGEHNGTFRGNNHAFVTATAALETFWQDAALMKDVHVRAQFMSAQLQKLAKAWGGEHRGLGMIQGIAFRDSAIASQVARAAFAQGVVVETAGPQDEVLKLLPPLTISAQALAQGLDIVDQALQDVMASRSLGKRGDRPRVFSSVQAEA